MNNEGHQGKVTALILAAGNSSRFGSCKFLMPSRQGKTILECAVDAFRQNFIDEIWVVTSSRQLTAVRALNLDGKVRLIENPAPQLERFHSVHLGLKHCEDADFLFIHNADMPEIDTETVRNLYENRCETRLVVPVFEGKHGHPILLNRGIMDHLQQLPTDSNLRLALSVFQTRSVPVKQPGILLDVDTVAEYEQMMAVR